MAIDVHELQAEESEQLARLSEDVFDDPIDAARAREFLADPRHHLVVARDEGVVVGMVSAVHYVHPDKAAPELWINEVGVAGSHQGQGIGRRLLAAMLARGRALGCREAWVLTHPDNEAACRLYESAGGVADPRPVRMYEFPLEP